MDCPGDLDRATLNIIIHKDCYASGNKRILFMPASGYADKKIVGEVSSIFTTGNINLIT